ncbi:hypothetical protein ACIQCV_07570 [Dietzia maris]|jgi:PKD repeat protein|uniref:Uncharacterized protein n=2 Tax=Dietzia maris TaxID=37915 RepID=A0A365PA46_9ACTN|nr:hypothetical protein [Dietzia sp. IN118]MDV3354611.1 hypothetical protein [Dietzia sp. IN118]RBA36302.1 hypothetical protein DQ226_09335 [Dietzia maris]
MFQRRSHRTAPRARSLALGGALAALAVVGGGTVAAVGAPAAVDAGDIQLTQNATGQAGAQELPLGTAVNLDLEPVVAQAAGGTIPPGTTVQVTGLPDGLTQNGWVISGTPTRAGEYEVLVTVSNSGISQSEKVAITVTDGAGAPSEDEEATTSPAITSPAATTATTTDETATTETTTTATQSDPTLSAVPGDPTAEDDTLAGDEGDGTGAGDGETTGDDDEVGATPDLCAVVGDGQMDGASLAQLVPLVTGGDDAESAGLVMVLLNTVVNLLPSVLGEGGSVESLGSVGQILCSISPSLLGGLTGGETATGGATTTAGGDATTGGATTGAAVPGDGPAALLGLLTTGAGSLGQ